MAELYFSNRTRRGTSSGQKSFLPIGVVNGKELEVMERMASLVEVEQLFGDGEIFIDSGMAMAMLNGAWGRGEVDWGKLRERGVTTETIDFLEQMLGELRNKTKLIGG